MKRNGNGHRNGLANANVNLSMHFNFQQSARRLRVVLWCSGAVVRAQRAAGGGSASIKFTRSTQWTWTARSARSWASSNNHGSNCATIEN